MAFDKWRKLCDGIVNHCRVQTQPIRLDVKHSVAAYGAGMITKPIEFTATLSSLTIAFEIAADVDPVWGCSWVTCMPSPRSPPSSCRNPRMVGRRRIESAREVRVSRRRSLTAVQRKTYV